MPEGTTQDLVYQRAVRGRFAPLIMISGPSGTGKTYSALRLATGIAGEDGKIFVADTDNSRAKLYADQFEFMHLDLREPFRPMLFEQAAIAAHKQQAAVLVIDNFAAEWTGPGGILEWHEEELARLAGDNFQRRESLKMVCWGKVKPPHKHMLQRLYQLNMPIILCAFAEKKIAMIKATEGKDKGKIIPTDQGFQPIGDKDAAYAMTASLLLQDVHNPGVPTPIKALLPALKPIIHLDRPLDEETGRQIAAWARGEKGLVPQEPKGEASTETSQEKSAPPPEHTTSESDQTNDREQRIAEGAKALAAKFAAIKTRQDHLALVDDKDTRERLDFLRKRRKSLFDETVGPAIKAAWARTAPPPDKPDVVDQQGDLIDDKVDRAPGDPGS
jgi:hypothetical protein